MPAYIYRRDATEAAHERMRTAPALLTDTDLDELALIDPALADQARVARTAAQAPAPIPASATPPAHWWDALATPIAAAINKAVAVPLARVAALEARIAVLEARPMPKYDGVHEDGKHYDANTLVTRSGGLWFATSATSATPGTDAAWRLIVKSGRA